MGPKTRPAKRQRSESPEDEDDIEVDPVDDNAVAAAVLESVASGAQSASARPSKRARTEAKRSLFVRSLPAAANDESLAVFFSEHYPVKHATVVVDPKSKTSRGYGFVTLADPDDAAKAKESLDNALWEGRRLKIEVAEPRQRDDRKRDDRKGQEGSGVAPPEASRPAARAERQTVKTKLIVRNLPWSVKTSEQLGALFRPYGLILSAVVPQAKGKLAGFGFVTIRGKKNSENAMENMNGREIEGRAITVDWALDREAWQQHKNDEAPVESGDAMETDEQEEKGNDGDWESDDEAEEADNTEEPAEKPGPKQAKSKEKSQLDADLEAFMKNHMENLDGDEDDEEDDDEQDGGVVKAQRAQQEKRLTDNTCTVFVRNLPFTTTEDQLKTFFDNFGKVRYARIVLDKATDRPAGTAFVCFFNEDDMKACVKNSPRTQPLSLTGKRSILQDENADPAGTYTLEGRVLRVTHAVSKEEATRLTAEGHGARKKEDRRRLFLLREGAVDTRSSLYRLLSPTEIKTREASAAQRKKLVEKNPSLHVSLTRLAVRNIPHDVPSKELKALAREAIVGFATDVKQGRRQPLSKEELARDGQAGKEAEHQRKLKGKGIVKQCKVVFETRDGSKTADETGGGRSRGYGFIEYTTHRHALMGLRWLNGHQLDSGKGKMRLIVEFAIENTQVIARRTLNETRARQSREKPAQKDDDDGQHIGRDAGSRYPAKPPAVAKKGPPPVREERSGRPSNSRPASFDKGRHFARNNASGDRDAKSKDAKSKAPYARESGDDKRSDGAMSKGQKQDLSQQIVARKRFMKKKKAASRKGA